MDWDKLRIFYSVAKAGSLTHGGNALNLSQSAVSRQISMLESELKTQLFSRHARGISLTTEGEILFQTAKTVFGELSAVKTRIQEAKDGLKGTLKIATTVGMATMWLPNHLKQFTEMYEDLDIQFVLTDGDVDFASGVADCAIRFGNSKTIESNLIKKHLLDVSLKLYGSQSYFEDYGRPEKPEDLQHHSLIAFGRNAVTPLDGVNWILGLGAPQDQPHKPRIELANAHGIMQCVRQGMGIATLADYIARDFDDLVVLFPELSNPFSELILVYPEQFETSQKIMAFSSFLENEIRTQPS